MWYDGRRLRVWTVCSRSPALQPPSSAEGRLPIAGHLIFEKKKKKTFSHLAVFGPSDWSSRCAVYLVLRIRCPWAETGLADSRTRSELGGAPSILCIPTARSLVHADHITPPESGNGVVYVRITA